ncbi:MULTISPECIES: helix-turn-helix transcriptional regulator [Spirosoma]|uniref:YafY family transcriptional regulator n=1 Tax=Spirosoma liriopis TaxID=2937440 RepID=A0ABT0HQC4_9BACT|nr:MULTISPECIES: YafY family protein [Spirosoma]MCK8494368.1 YafY family transcriptional regulator [Spirosoma liriopis]UHG89379.1 YafY family transcriptional regulator [Spirosoma oryzicola]
MNRLDRLTAILIHLQTKRVVRAQELADRFGISLRTVYRDVRSLEEAGVPIGAEAGVGYFLTDYHLPPVMFTNAEASSLLLAAKLIEKWTDQSVRTEFDSALFKIKSVLKRPDQEHLDDLAPNVDVSKPSARPPYADGLLSTIQQAIARHHVLDLHYHSLYNDTETKREVEPVGLYHYSLTWHLIGFCRIRQDYRDFRLDRIRSMTDTGQRFARHERLSLQEYIQRERSGCDMPVINVTLVFPKSVARFIHESKYTWGFDAEEDLGKYVRIHLNTPYLEGLARWLLTFGTTITIEQPDSLLTLMHTLAEEVRDHYAAQAVLT